MNDDLEISYWYPPPNATETSDAPLLNAIETATEQGFDQEAQELRSFLFLGQAH